MRRMLDPERMPAERVVVHFEFVGVPPGKAHFWLVLDRHDADLCIIDPGFGDDLLVRSRPGTIGTMWMGDRALNELVRDGAIKVSGLPRLARQLQGWLGTSTFGEIGAADVRRRAAASAGTPLDAT